MKAVILSTPDKFHFDPRAMFLITTGILRDRTNLTGIGWNKTDGKR